MLRLVTLDEVGRRALKCEEFFRQLVQDHEAALIGADLTLSLQDLLQLKTLLGNNQATVEVKMLLEMVHSSISAPLPAGGRTWK